MKFVVLQKEISYRYVVVEAESTSEAMRHIPTYGDAITVTGGMYQNMEAHPVKEGTSLMWCDFTCLPFVGWKIVSQNRKKNFIENWEKVKGWRPHLNTVNFSKIKPVNLPREKQ